MVGSAIERKLRSSGFNNIISKTSKELDLRNQQQVNDFNEAYKIAEVRFNEGATNQVEYLIAKNNLDKANINLIIARYDYIFRTKILDYYQGKLVL